MYLVSYIYSTFLANFCCINKYQLYRTNCLMWLPTQQYCVSGRDWKRPVRENQTYSTGYKHSGPIATS